MSATADPVSSNIPARLAALRRAMADASLSAWIAPSADPHLSEYLPARWLSRVWLSGFSGSAGTLVVTAEWAGLWTDSRYWTQAEAQLAGSGIDLMRIRAGEREPHVGWLASHLEKGARVGVDGAVLATASARYLLEACAEQGITVASERDLLDDIWTDRPGLPDTPVYEHVAPFATRTRQDKLALVRDTMRALGAHWHWVSTLDDIAWIFNLRGADVEHNPVFVAHALISMDTATLFVQPGKIDSTTRAALARDGVELAAYDSALTRLEQLGGAGATLLIDPRKITWGTLQAFTRAGGQALSSGAETALPAAQPSVIEVINPSTLEKSQKTAADASHVRATMEYDGAALCEFFAWFEQAMGRERITELTVDEQLTGWRARHAEFITTSFSTIAGFNANGAMPHYRATQAAHAVIEGDGLLLIDSGGQYLGGTTDITRVVPIGTPSAAQRRDFTLVLKAMIALSRARFPRGIRSPMIDAIARAPLWAEGLDYGHGTGHGVGYFLNVHEGPQVISYYANAEPQTAMQEGMITSIEPGVYRPGKWGVRIENLSLTIQATRGAAAVAKTAAADEGVADLADTRIDEDSLADYLEFETLTLCPIDTRCIDLALMRSDESAWLNDYHLTVRQRLAPYLQGTAAAWLNARTQPI
ncbi:MAG: aminopeptidase P family protein [Janthinobacterium lividum]